MGSQCRPLSLPPSSQFTSITYQQHLTFGGIYYMRSADGRLEKAVKRIPCPQDVERYRKKIQVMGDCGSVATIVKIYDFQVVQDNKQGRQIQRQFGQCKQPIQYPFILLHFHYIPQTKTLSYLLHQKRQSLSKLQKKYPNHSQGRAHSIHLNDYKQIDQLPSQQRQIVNCFSQQIQIVRMIDHLIGGLYFLEHYQMEHGAVRAEGVLMDQEGRFVSVEKEVFGMQSNYQIALKNIQGKMGGKELSDCLAPEWLPDLNNDLPLPSTHHNPYKADIFCLGVLALKMGTIDTQSSSIYSIDRQRIVLNKNVLTKGLMQIKRKYSSALHKLLVQMLKIEVRERIEIGQLIDQLNPILIDNLNRIKELYPPLTQGQNKSNTSASLSPLHQKVEVEHQKIYQQPDKTQQGQGKGKSIKDSLISIQDRFNRIMNNRTMLLQRAPNQMTLKQQQQRILSRLKQISTPKTHHDSHNKNTPIKTQIGMFRLGQSQRAVNGKDLQAIVHQEYQLMKSQRK